MDKIQNFFNNVKLITIKLAQVLLGLVAVLSLVDILLPKSSLGVLSAVVSTVKGLIASGSSVGLSGLIVLAIVIIALKKS